MGWAYCGTDSRGREIGYAIEATCDWRGCTEEITRGLDSVCGTMHEDTETGCGRYFCEAHQRKRWGRDGERSGCDHRGKYAWGRTACQIMWEDARRGHRTRVYCACHQWEMEAIMGHDDVTGVSLPFHASVGWAFNVHKRATHGWGPEFKPPDYTKHLDEVAATANAWRAS